MPFPVPPPFFFFFLGGGQQFASQGPAQTLSMVPELPVRIHVKRRPKGEMGEKGEVDAPADFVVDCPSWFCIHLSHASQVRDLGG